MNEWIIYGLILFWVIFAEYTVLDFYYFRREQRLRREMFEDYMESLDMFTKMINKHCDGVKISFQKIKKE